MTLRLSRFITAQLPVQRDAAARVGPLDPFRDNKVALGMNLELSVLSESLIHSAHYVWVGGAVVIDKDEAAGLHFGHVEFQILTDDGIVVVAIQYKDTDIIRDDGSGIVRKGRQRKTDLLGVSSSDVVDVSEIIALRVEKIWLETVEWVNAENWHGVVRSCQDLRHEDSRCTEIGPKFNDEPTGIPWKNCEDGGQIQKFVGIEHRGFICFSPLHNLVFEVDSHAGLLKNNLHRHLRSVSGCDAPG